MRAVRALADRARVGNGVTSAVRARGLQAEPGFEMLIQQTPYYLEFFGFAELARQVRTDASSLRRLIYPPELL